MESQSTKTLFAGIGVEVHRSSLQSTSYRSHWRQIDLASNGIEDKAAQELLWAAAGANVTIGMAGNEVSANVFGKAAILQSNAVV